jgi:hypothetical protein
LTALKQISFSKDIPLDVMKKRGQQLGLTLNEVFFSLLSQTMKQLLIRQNDSTTQRICAAIPFSLRPQPTSILDFKLNNSFAILPVEMRLIED